MAFEDRLITETADKRNELEAYIYAMRAKLDGVYKPYGSEAEKNHMQVCRCHCFTVSLYFFVCFACCYFS